MGTQKNYDPIVGKVKEHHYANVGQIMDIKVIAKTVGQDNGLPKYSITSNIYIYYSNQKEIINRVGFYDENHQLILRMEWDHPHGQFKKGTPHVQNLIDGSTRAPNEYEQKIFDELKRRNFKL